ncbi:MAG: class I fructose-bisphosphate aldolase [Burkholderiaceae bacterium]
MLARGRLMFRDRKADLNERHEQQDARTLAETAQAMVADGKGLFVMVESKGTCNRRLATAVVGPPLEMRRGYRELLLTTPGPAP